LFFSDAMLGSKAQMEWYDITGRSMGTEEFTVTGTSLSMSVDLMPGVYILSLEVNGITYKSRILKK
jgi:hypothetical protein